MSRWPAPFEICNCLARTIEEADWLKIPPINDQLRALQRNALVAHILEGLRSTPATATSHP